MGKIWMPGGGGGGAKSDETNVTKEYVLAGRTYIGSDTDDEVGTGTMPDKAGTTQSASGSIDSANKRVQLTIPSLGRYSTTSKLYIAYSTLASLIGLTAAKLWPNNTVLGITSNKQTMGQQTITPSTSQQTVSCSGKAMTGNVIVNAIPNIKGAITDAVSAMFSSNYIHVRLSRGYYNTNASSGYPEARVSASAMRNTLGISADKIKKGVSICGITGTFEGYVADPNYLYKPGVDSGNWAADPDYPQDLTKESGMMVLDPSSYGANWIYTRNSYNFTGYTKFNIDVMPVGSNVPTMVRLLRYKNDGGIGEDIDEIESPGFSNGVRKTLTFDISNFNATCQPQIWFHRSTSPNYKMNIYNVWLS